MMKVERSKAKICVARTMVDWIGSRVVAENGMKKVEQDKTSMVMERRLAVAGRRWMGVCGRLAGWRQVG
jgi:hypothetical protein